MKMITIHNKRRGSIILFTLVSIAVLSTVVLLFLGGRTQKKVFYKESAQKYGFIDDRGNLRGSEPVRREEESIRNLVFGLIRTRAQSGQKLFEADQTSDQNIVFSANDFTRALGWIGMKWENIKHNSKMNVDSGVTILPLDNKIPFTEKFEGEIRKLIELVFADPTVLVGNDAARTAAVNEIVGLIGSENEIGVSNFAELQSFKTLFRGNVQKGRNAINLLRKSLCFCKDVEAVNFFMANKYVQRAICESFNDRPNNRSNFTFNAQGELIQNRTNAESLHAMYEAMSPHGRWKENHSRGNPTVEDMYDLRTDDKVLLWNDNGTIRSYSKVFEVIAHADDEEHSEFKSERTHICKLPKCEAYPKE